MLRIIILLLISAFLNAEYVPNQILIKFKPKRLSIQSVKPITALDLPVLTQKINAANKLKAFKPLIQGDAVDPANFNSLTALRAQKEMIAQSEEAQGLTRIYEFTFESSVNIPLLVEQYKSDPEVEYAQPNYIYEALAVYPDDPNTPNQTYLTQIYAPEGWAVGTGSSTIVVAVIDTGISLNHPDLAAKIVSGYDYINNDSNADDDEGHGTVCAGIIAAQTNNNQGIAGVDWNAKLMPVKVLDSTGSGTSTTVANGIRFAYLNGAKVINLSLGIPESNDPVMENYCNTAYNNFNVLLVASMGNVNIPKGYYKNSIVYPAAYDSVIGIGSISATNVLSTFSIIGRGNYTTELVAPGEAIFSTNRIAPAYTDQYKPGYDNNGTSFSAPQVSALCSLMKAVHPSLTNEQIRIYLHKSADDLGGVGYDSEYGYGRINVYNALNLISTYSASGSALKDVWNYPNPVTGGKDTKFSFKSDTPIKSVEVTVYDLKGRVMNTLSSGGQTSGYYETGSWDCTDINGRKLPNGSYIYVIKATQGDGAVVHSKGKLAIVN